jgi:hypothetical protein
MEKHDAALIHQFIAAGEYALALEELAGFLAVAGTLITGRNAAAWRSSPRGCRWMTTFPAHWRSARAR